MARTRYIQDPDTGELVPAEQYVPRSRFNPHHLIIGDSHYDGLRAPDGADISTRTKHREYMKQHGLTTMDDFSTQWKGDAKRRAEYLQTGKGGATRREDVARAIAELERRR